MDSELVSKIMQKYTYLKIIETPNHGLGAQCNKDFKKDEVVFAYKDGILMDKQTQHSLQIRLVCT